MSTSENSRQRKKGQQSTATAKVITDGQSVQFWRESRYLNRWPLHPTWRESSDLHRRPLHPTTKDDMSPMTTSQTLQGHSSSRTSNQLPPPPPSLSPSTTTRKTSPAPMMKNAPSRDEGCYQALERAVLLTAHSSLVETCVLVTHREAIRFIETHWVSPSTNTKIL